MTKPGDAGSASRADDRLLGAVVDIAAGLELPQTLRRIVRAAVDLVEAQYGALGVLGSDGQISEFIVEGLSDDAKAAIGSLPKGAGILGLLIREPSPIRLHDLHDHPASVGFPAHHPVMRSFMGAPIRGRGEVFGNLYLTEKRHGKDFSEEDERLLVALAAAAGVAIENARLYAEAERRSGWLRAASEIATGALQGDGPEDVLQQVAAEASRAAESAISLICVPRDGGGYVISHVHGASEVSTWLGRSVADPTSLARAAESSLTVAMSTPDRDLGCLVLLRSSGSAFTQDECSLAEAFGRQAALAVVLAAARGQHERLALLEDRDRIGRDLHDLVIQRLFATGMMLQGAQRLAANPEVDERIGRAVEELDQTILEVRSTIFALHESRDGQAHGLRAQVLREVASGSGALGFEPTVRFDGPIDSTIPDDVAEHVIAALREALSNAARHAKASQVRVSLSVDSGEVVLIVTDNGRGIDPTTDRRSGLANLESRASALGGRFGLEPLILGDSEAEVAGTRLTWRAPLTSEPSHGVRN